MKVIFSTLVIFSIFTTMLIAYKINNMKSDIIYATCNQARISQQSNSSCGELQARWNREFLCNDNNTNVNTNCWVEIK